MGKRCWLLAAVALLGCTSETASSPTPKDRRIGAAMNVTHSFAYARGEVSSLSDTGLRMTVLESIMCATSGTGTVFDDGTVTFENCIIDEDNEVSGSIRSTEDAFVYENYRGKNDGRPFSMSGGYQNLSGSGPATFEMTVSSEFDGETEAFEMTGELTVRADGLVEGFIVSRSLGDDLGEDLPNTTRCTFSGVTLEELARRGEAAFADYSKNCEDSYTPPDSPPDSGNETDCPQVIETDEGRFEFNPRSQNCPEGPALGQEPLEGSCLSCAYIKAGTTGGGIGEFINVGIIYQSSDASVESCADLARTSACNTAYSNGHYLSVVARIDGTDCRTQQDAARAVLAQLSPSELAISCSGEPFAISSSPNVSEGVAPDYRGGLRFSVSGTPQLPLTLTYPSTECDATLDCTPTTAEVTEFSDEFESGEKLVVFDDLFDCENVPLTAFEGGVPVADILLTDGAGTQARIVEFGATCLSPPKE